MKYTRIQRVVRKIYDDNISDIDTIKSILEGIKKKQLFCSLTIDVDFQIVFHKKVRILEINEQSFKYRAFSGHAMVKDSLEYENLKEVRLETETEQIVDTQDKDSRWYMLDLEE